MNLPQPHVKQLSWDAHSVLIMHSDGLTARWEWESIAASLAVSSSVVARQLLKGYSRPDDDATVLVAKSKERRH
jgi:serine/threonine protein phosphatase PrpC